MVQIAGKYQNERNENFVEFMMSTDSRITEEFAKKVDGDRPSLEVVRNGDVCTFTSSSGRAETFTFGKAFDDNSTGTVLQCVATQDGNKIEIKPVNGGDQVAKRVYEFTDTGLIVHYYNSSANGRRFYNRV